MATYNSTTGGGTRRALLVDDDRMMLAVVADLLRDIGVSEVVTGHDGGTGMVAFDRMKPAPDLVVCDLNMPGGDGFKFMEQLGSRSFAGGVVIISGLEQRILSSASLMARFHNLNILDTLKKPIDRHALSTALSKLA